MMYALLSKHKITLKLLLEQHHLLERTLQVLFELVFKVVLQLNSLVPVENVVTLHYLRQFVVCLRCEATVQNLMSSRVVAAHTFLLQGQICGFNIFLLFVIELFGKFPVGRLRAAVRRGCTQRDEVLQHLMTVAACDLLNWV